VALGLEDKKAIVAEVRETAANALSVVIADARGVSVGHLTALRKRAREEKVHVRVIRNTLAKRAVEGTAFECIAPALKGPSLLAFSMEDPGAGARIFKDFAKQVEAFEVKALAASGRLMGPERQVRSHGQRGARQACPHHRCHPGPERGCVTVQIRLSNTPDFVGAMSNGTFQR
jgi:large subunit ribosomal protein L10